MRWVLSTTRSSISPLEEADKFAQLKESACAWRAACCLRIWLLLVGVAMALARHYVANCLQTRSGRELASAATDASGSRRTGPGCAPALHLALGSAAASAALLFAGSSSCP